jgi:hypothetical protein
MQRLRASLPWQDITEQARLLWHLPSFLRSTFTLDEARAILRDRLERRELAFLDLARRAIFQHGRGPYHQLLRLVGCEYGDLERLASQDGLEGTLRGLARQGVYLTVDEFKGRRPVVRGSATLTVDPRHLRNPLPATHLEVETGGSRGVTTSFPIGLAFIRDHAINTFLTLDAHGGVGWQHANWGVPGGAGLTNVLEFSSGGAPAVRWFSQVDPAALGVSPRYRWSARALGWASVVAGAPLPRPEYVSLNDPLPIARWMVEVLQNGATPHLWTYASSAVRVCQAALEAGLELRGARFTAGGEPSTAARLAAIRRTGADAAPRYGTTETDIIAYACRTPEAPDDMHLLDDRHALIQPDGGGYADLPPKTLLFSSLLPSSPVILMNVSLGDHAVIAQRSCGCPLEELGWRTHLHTVRSFEKLTAGGMNFLDTDVIRVLEEVLPARFGGGLNDYQLVEEETDHGDPRLRLLVHPGVGVVDPEAVVDALLSAIEGESSVKRVMSLQWRESGLLRVEREAPRATSSGKIQHLHRQRRSSRRPDSLPQQVH